MIIKCTYSNFWSSLHLVEFIIVGIVAGGGFTAFTIRKSRRGLLEKRTFLKSLVLVVLLTSTK